MVSILVEFFTRIEINPLKAYHNPPCLIEQLDRLKPITALAAFLIFPLKRMIELPVFRNR